MWKTRQLDLKPSLVALFCLTLASSVSFSSAEDVKVKVESVPTGTTAAPAAAAAATQELLIDTVANAANQPVRVLSATTEVPKSESSSSTSTNPAAIPASPVEGKGVASAEIPLASAAGVNSKSAGPEEKLDKYLEPICNLIEKLQPAQLFKIQSQMKAFVSKTNGKLSACFLDAYEMNPNLVPVTKQQLNLICDSRKLDKEVKGSFKAFKRCAVDYWEASLGAELERINVARANCSKNHEHSKQDAAVSLSHDDEVSLIGDVFNKMIEDAKGAGSNKPADIKMIDVSGGSSTPKPVSVAAGAIAKSLETNKAILNDPNTLVVLVDEAKAANASSEIAAATVSTGSTTSSPTSSAATSSSESPAASKTTPTPAAAEAKTGSPLVAKILVAASTTSSTTAAPEIKVHVKVGTTSTTSSPKAETSPHPTVKVIIEKATTTTTSAPNKSHTGKTTAAASSTERPTTKAPVKAIDTLRQVLDRQEKQKQELDKRLKAEREKVINQLKRKQDEEDAKKAIRSLQLQREASQKGHNNAADARMHRLEHERQMAIDPVGHSIKHQQFELSKQKKAQPAN